MQLPCEYCRTMLDGEPAMRLGVWPCCRACSWIPASVGILGLVGIGIPLTLLVIALLKGG